MTAAAGENQVPGAPGALILVGSTAPAARALVERLAGEGTLVLTISRQAVLDADESFLMGIRSGAAVAIKRGQTVLVRSENWAGALEVTLKLAAKRWIPAETVSERVRGMLARVAAGVLEATGCGTLAVVGTETGQAVCERLGIADPQAGLPPLRLLLQEGSTAEAERLLQAIK